MALMPEPMKCDLIRNFLSVGLCSSFFNAGLFEYGVNVFILVHFNVCSFSFGQTLKKKKKVTGEPKVNFIFQFQLLFKGNCL